MSLRVLITNQMMGPPSGTVLFVRDLALELQRQGHVPSVFSPVPCTVPEELRAAGIPVGGDLTRLGGRPDVIHGHHVLPTLMAVRHWPTVPAINVCHDHLSVDDRPPLHPRIHRYFGVSRVCVERLIESGVPLDRAQLLLNFVDTRRFLPRPPLPEQPRKALIFSNYASPDTHLPAVTEACRRAAIELDVVGARAGRPVASPENVLGPYDIVFAKGKAAIEAMAVGSAVVLCDYSGVGPMVTARDFDALRPLNFGFQALRGRLDPELVLHEIARYDARDAARVRDKVRAMAGLDQAVVDLVRIYRAVLAEDARAVPRTSHTEGGSLRARVLVELLSLIHI